MRIAAILPHLKQFGGVRRFLELALVFQSRGHEYEVVLPDAQEHCGWFDGAVTCHNLKSRKYFGYDRLKFDVVLIGDPPSFPLLKKVEGQPYIYVIAGGEYILQYRKLYGKHPFLLNNRCFLEPFPEARLVEGGVNTAHFRIPRSHPRSKAIWVGYQGGRGDTKGEAHIVEQLSGIGGLRTMGIEGETNDGLPLCYYMLDFFVSWQERPGWANMAAEALACGIPVVTNGKNVEPFIDRCIVVDNLREFFTNPMAEFSWERVADRLEEIWKEDGICK